MSEEIFEREENFKSELLKHELVGAWATWLKFAAIALITVDVLLRFVNLDLKPYWYDEAYTSLQLSGYHNDSEIRQQIANGRVVTIDELQKYQYPSREKSVADTVQGLAVKEPQLPPVYFSLLRGWVQGLGSSIAVTRSLSVLFSLLALPCVFWLGWELFRSKTVAWVATTLVALSPYHLLYAQEARPISLWILATLLSSATLLRALRLQTSLSWAAYSASIVLGLYSFLLHTIVCLAHATYVTLLTRLRLSKTLIAYGIASAIGLLAFLPWIFLALLPNRAAMQGQSAATTPLNLLKGMFRGLSLPYLDFNLNEQSAKLLFAAYLVATLAIVLLAFYGLYRVYRSTDRAVGLFLLTLTLVPLGLLLVSDLATGASRSATARYLVPTLLGTELALAYLFTVWLGALAQRLSGQNWLRGGIVGLVLLLSFASCVTFARSELWWSKAFGNVDRQAARVINQAERPLVVSDRYFASFLALSHSLDKKTKVQLFPDGSAVAPTQAPEVASGFSDVFVYLPSPAFLNSLKAGYEVAPLQPTDLWKLGKSLR